jgi:hypothetical protein
VSAELGPGPRLVWPETKKMERKLGFIWLRTVCHVLFFLRVYYCSCLRLVTKVNFILLLWQENVPNE